MKHKGFMDGVWVVCQKIITHTKLSAELREQEFGSEFYAILLRMYMCTPLSLLGDLIPTSCCSGPTMPWTDISTALRATCTATGSVITMAL